MMQNFPLQALYIIPSIFSPWDESPWDEGTPKKSGESTLTSFGTVSFICTKRSALQTAMLFVHQPGQPLIAEVR